MNLNDQISEDLKKAMKSHDAVAVNALRMVRSQLKDAQIAKGEPLEENEVIDVLLSAAKKRRESIEFFRQGGRDELVAQETAELDVISRYLPEQMCESEISQIVTAVIAELGASGPSDMGKVMGAAMKQLKGKADGKLVQSIVRDQLA